jgi:G3E family GTPase
MKILIVSGFLGAGKTTFIQALARHSGRVFAVFENEYGPADLDARVLEADGLRVWELTENCVCCTGKGDFAASVVSIANTLAPDVLVVEPTGAARLGSILSNLEQLHYGSLSVLPPVTILDGRSWAVQRREAPELWLDQVRSAAVVVCSKLEQADAAEREELRRELAALNPRARILAEPYARQEAAWWAGLLEGAGPGPALAPREAAAEDDAFQQLTLEGAALPSPTHLIAFLERLSRGEFGRIPRAKGVLRCGGEALRFDAVGGAWAVTGAPEGTSARCVFIGRELDRVGLLRLLSGRPAVRGAAKTAARPVTYRPRGRRPAP